MTTPSAPDSSSTLNLLQVGSIQLPGGIEAAKLVLDPAKLLDMLAGQTTAALPTSEQANAPAQRNVREAVRHLRHVAIPPCQTVAIQLASNAAYQNTGIDIGNARLLGVIFANADASAATTLAITGGDRYASDGKDRAVVTLLAGTNQPIMFPGSGVDLSKAGLSANGLSAAPATGGNNPGTHIWALNTAASTAYITLLISGAA